MAYRTHMVDYNRDAERARARRAGRLGAWRHLVHLQPDDIRAVLMEMLADLDDGAIPAVAPASESAQPSVASAPAPTAAAAHLVPVPAATPAARPQATAREQADRPEDDEAGADELADDADGNEKVGDLARSVLQASGKALSAPEIAEEVQRLSPKTDRRQVIQWLTREYVKKDGHLVRRGQRGSFRYTLKSRGATKMAEPAVEKAPERTATPVTDAESESIASQLLKHLASGPRGLDELATEILGSAHGEPRKTVRNILYYLRDKKALVRRREEDGNWEVITQQ